DDPVPASSSPWVDAEDFHAETLGAAPDVPPLAPCGRPGREADCRSRHVLRLPEHLGERVREPIDVTLLDDERRQSLEHVDAVAGDLAEDSVVAEERADHELAEEARLAAVDEAPHAAASRRLAELDRPH